MNLISITGPESTGKSWLAQKLAEHYGTNWVPEFAREYLDNLGRPYRFEDISKIARGQLILENEIAGKTDSLLFCDTDLLVTKIWSEVKYQTCDPWIIRQLKIHRYDLYLLCDIDLQWEEDPLREHPGRRIELFDLYKKNLEEMRVQYSIIRGIGTNRLDCAIEAIEKSFNHKTLTHIH